MLRALIPAGFMPVAGAHGLEIGFCPDAAALPPGLAAAADPHAHRHHHHHHDTAGGTHGSDPSTAMHQAPCLFAASAMLAGAPAAAFVPAQALPGRGPRAAEPGSRVFVPSILRAQSARGPPADI